VLAGLEALQMDDAIFRPRAGGGPRVAVAKRPTNTGRAGTMRWPKTRRAPGSIVFVLESMTRRPCRAIVTSVREIIVATDRNVLGTLDSPIFHHKLVMRNCSHDPCIL